MIEMGTEVTWNNGQQRGLVTDMFDRKITWRLQGSDVRRVETNDKTTYLIRLNNGDFILKHHHEVAIAS
jgi:hypothetical protein